MQLFTFDGVFTPHAIIMRRRAARGASTQPVKEIYNHYILFEDGRVYSTLRGRFLTPYGHQSGYPTYVLSINGKRTNKHLHRLVAEAFIPNPDKLPQVNHKNGIKTDNSPENLEWCTNRDNALHAYQHGLMRFSSNTGHRYISQLTKRGRRVFQFTKRLTNGSVVSVERSNLAQAIAARDTFLASIVVQ